MRKAESRVARYRSLAMYDLTDAVRRDSDLAGKLRRRDANSDKFFSENFTWMDWLWWHEQSPFSCCEWSMRTLTHDVNRLWAFRNMECG